MIMTRALWLLAATGSVLALTGVPATSPLAGAYDAAARQMIGTVAATAPRAALIDGTWPWAEPGSLLLAAAGFFGAAAAIGRGSVNRRQNRRGRS